MKFKVVMLGLLLVCASAVQAETKAVPSYDSLDAIPAILRQPLSGGDGYREAYINKIMLQLRRSAADHITLSKSDIERMRAEAEQQMRRQQVSQVLKYDVNFDGIVTREEVTAKITERYDSAKRQEGRDYSARINKDIESVMKLDTNNDGSIGSTEMSVFKQTGYSGPQEKNIEDLLALDTNGDGKLDAVELEALAHKAFNTVDINGDGLASAEERKKVSDMNLRVYEASKRISPSCQMRQAEQDEKVILIGVHEGKAVSNISVAGQTEETTVIPLVISKGKEKLFIIVASYSPVIWKVTGDVGRISHLALGGVILSEMTGNSDAGVNNINVGATGVPNEKVSFFRAYSCGLGKLWDKKRPVESHAVPVKLLIGANPHSIVTTHGVREVRIDGSVAVLENENEKPDVQKAPEGFDKDVWAEHLRNMPGGLIHLTLKDVVSHSPAVVYEVLPKWAGLAKLLHEGAIERFEKKQRHCCHGGA